MAGVTRRLHAHALAAVSGVTARAGHHWHTLNTALPSPVRTSNDTCASHARRVVWAHAWRSPEVLSVNTFNPDVLTLSGTVSSRKASSRLPKSMLTSISTGRGGSTRRRVVKVASVARKSNICSSSMRPVAAAAKFRRPHLAVLFLV